MCTNNHLREGSAIRQFNVTGMSCAACSARVEKAVSQVDGVTSCSVSLLTNSMGVEGSASPESIIAAVRNAGYGASLREGGKPVSPAGGGQPENDPLADRETPEDITEAVITAAVTITADTTAAAEMHLLRAMKSSTRP